MDGLKSMMTKPKIDEKLPDILLTATFAMGWFWGPDARFGLQKGVYCTRVGYCGGTTENPTYESIGDYSETIQLDYNPEEITYEELLEIFFESHSPEYNMPMRQYMSVIFYHDEKQRDAADKELARQQEKRGTKLYTLILPYEKLFLAEAYHQKYYLQLVDILKGDMRSHYPKLKDFIDSTAAARINGYVKGLGTTAQLNEEIDLLGLSDKAKKRLTEIVDSY